MSGLFKERMKLVGALAVIYALMLTFMLWHASTVDYLPSPKVHPPEIPTFYNECQCANNDLLHWRMYLHSGNGMLIQEHYIYLLGKPHAEYFETFFLYGAELDSHYFAEPIYQNGHIYFKQDGK